MPDLKDERILSKTVRDLRSHVAAEQAARERAQQALREIEDALSEEVPSACACEDCTRLRAIIAIARKGLGEMP